MVLGQQGNKIADTLATDGASINYCGPEPFSDISVATVKTENFEWLLDQSSVY